MDERSALRTAAMRYCLERMPSGLRWGAPASERHYRDPTLAPHPRDPDFAESVTRSWTLAAIYDAVEALTPTEFPAPDAVREAIIRAGESAKNEWFDRPQPLSDDEQRWVADERQRFCAHVRRLTAADLRIVNLLPYYRRLADRESERIWARLKRMWGIEPGEYWYPLAPMEPPPHTIAVVETWYAWEVPLETTRSILASRRVHRILQTGFRGDYELDLSYFIPRGYETFFTSEKMNWVMYTSHEGSLTIGGEWLVNLVKAAWPNWKQHLYRDWHNEHPPYHGRHVDEKNG